MMAKEMQLANIEVSISLSTLFLAGLPFRQLRSTFQGIIDVRDIESLEPDYTI